MSQLYSYSSATITFGGVDIAFDPARPIEVEEHPDRVGLFKPITGTITFTPSEGLSGWLRSFTRRWRPLTRKHVRRRERAERAWHRREAQRVFQRACRAGVRLNASAADVVRALKLSGGGAEREGGR